MENNIVRGQICSWFKLAWFAFIQLSFEQNLAMHLALHPASCYQNIILKKKPQQIYNSIFSN